MDEKLQRISYVQTRSGSTLLWSLVYVVGILPTLRKFHDHWSVPRGPETATWRVSWHSQVYNSTEHSIDLYTVSQLQHSMRTSMVRQWKNFDDRFWGSAVLIQYTRVTDVTDYIRNFLGIYVLQHANKKVMLQTSKKPPGTPGGCLRLPVYGRLSLVYHIIITV